MEVVSNNVHITLNRQNMILEEASYKIWNMQTLAVQTNFDYSDDLKSILSGSLMPTKVFLPDKQAISPVSLAETFTVFPRLFASLYSTTLT